MATSEEDYQRALRAIGKAKADPTLVSADTLETLVSIVKSYRGQKEGLEARAPSDFGEHSSIGPTGLDAMRAGGLPDADAAEESSRQLAAAETAHPGVAKALKLSQAAQFSPIPGETASEENARHVDFDSSTYDERIPNASKRKDLAAPPEFIPSPVGESPLERTRKMLPEHFGGATEHYLEPGIEQFRRDMAPVLGHKVLTLGEGSDEYKIYADKLWKGIYEQAQTEGRPVVREAYKANPKVEDKLLHGVEAGLGVLGSGAIGADKALSGGYFSRNLDPANRDAVEGANPLAADVGFAAGAVAPLSAGNLAAGGIGKLLGAPSGALGKLLLGGGKGAVAGGVTGALASPEQRTEGGAEGALLGAPLGALGAGLGALIEGEGQALRRNTPLGLAEKGGARTSLVSGVKPGKAYEELQGRARARQVGPPDKPDIQTLLASELEDPLVRTARARRGAGQERIGKANEEFRAKYSENRVDSDELLGAASKAHEELLDAQGNVLPAARSGAQKLRTLIGDLVDVEVVAPGTEGGISLADAQRAGLPVDAAVRGEGMTELPEDTFIRVKPRAYNVGEVDQVIAKLQEMEGAGQAAREPIHQYDAIKKAAHQLRDKVAGGTEAIPEKGSFELLDEQGRPTMLKGYSASQARAAREIGAESKSLELAGLPRGDIPETLDANQSERFVGSVRGYGEAGRQPAKDDALRGLADAAGTRGKLDQIAYSRAIERLEDLAKIRNMFRLRGSSAVPQEALSGVGLRLRADPFLQGLAPSAAGLGGAGALPGQLESRLPPQADQPTIDQISRLLGPPGAF